MKPVFTISRRLTGFSYHALFKYYSAKLFSDEKLSEEDIQNRKLVAGFRKGINTREVVEIVKTAIQQKATKNFNENSAVFMVIPASYQADHTTRYKYFCEIVSKKLGISNGYDAIKILYDKEDLSDEKNENKTENLSFDSRYFKDKAVVLFDDLIVTAELFKQVSNKLIDLGAKKVTGAVLGEAVAWDEEKNA